MYRIGMRWILLTVTCAALTAACGTVASRGEGALSPAQTVFPDLTEKLEDRGPAPEIENEVWLNSENPLRLAALHGNVVLLDFWTFG